MPARLVSWALRHRTTKCWLSVEGHPVPSPDGVRTFTTHDRADAFRRRYLQSFADAWRVEPLPSPEPAKAA